MTAKAGGATELALDKMLDLNAAGSLHGKLMALRGSDVAIDGSAVERAGALCIQVLMSAARTWEEDKKSFVFSKMSEALTKTMQLIGVTHDHLLVKEGK